MGDLRALVWFVFKSWRYLGCDRGAGRWSARRRYITGLPGAARVFLTVRAADRRAILGDQPPQPRGFLGGRNGG